MTAAKPPTPTLAELREMPVVLDFAQTCGLLGISESTGNVLIKASRFPIEPMPHTITKRLYALSDVIRYFGFDPKSAAA
jgi:hypothetical protein